MNRRLTLLPILFLSAFNLFSQDWALFPQGQKSTFLFSTYTNLIYGLNPHIVITVGDTTTSYFAYENIDFNEYTCQETVDAYFPIDGYDMLPGLDSIVYVNGQTSLYGYGIDFLMTFNNNANTGDTFHLLSPDNEDIYMKCFLAMEDDVFGVMDSVKKFKFYKESGTTLLNDFTIVLSKHYGLLSFLDFYDLANFDGYGTPRYYSLLGLKTPSNTIGYQYKDWTNFFPYSTGDIRIWRADSYNPDPFNYIAFTQYFKDSITSVNYYPDSIVYTYNRTKKDTDDVLTYIFDIHHNFKKEDFTQFITAYPSKPVLSNCNEFNPWYSEEFKVWNNAGTSYILDGGDTITTYRWTSGAGYVDTTICEVFEIYDVGNGITLNDQHGVIFMSQSINDFSYTWALIGGTLNGEPFGETDFGHLTLTAQEKQPLHIYPNPVSDNISITGLTQQNERYVIYTITGICVQQGFPESEIDVRNLQSGMYFIQIGNSTASFIKQ